MKGYSTQAAVLLTRGPMSIDDVEKALAELGSTVRHEVQTHWAYGPDTVSLGMRAHAKGHVVVDYVAEPWPDNMGDERTQPEIWAAFSAGYFGPFTYMSSLDRACQQAWNWPEGAEEAPDHDGFIRILTTYRAGAEDQSPPPKVDAVAELNEVTGVAERLAQLPGVVCYFNPNGETLYPPKQLAETTKRNRKNRLPDLDLWTNVRFIDMAGHAPGWFVADTCGMGQLDLPDIEAVYPRESYDPDEVAEFLRGLSLYLFRNRNAIRQGDTTDGPGGIDWQAYTADQALSSPPRKTIRWFPIDGAQRPQALMKSLRPRT